VTIDSLPTPAALIDRARLVANMDRMQSAADAAGVRLRPHSKTHKSPRVAKWQIKRGAVGICCAKLSEAEVFADAGVADIRLPYPINPSNADRVIQLLDRTHLSFVVDHAMVARQWSNAMSGAGRAVDVLVKVDVGFHRCGIDPQAADAVDMVREVASLPGLRLRGLLAHAGHAYHAHSEDHMRDIAESEARTLSDLASACRRVGVRIEELSAGATPSARHSLRQPFDRAQGKRGLTEYRPGNYVYFDRTQVALGAAALDDCALTVLATVVSRPAVDRIILDCGSKTLSSDSARGFTPAPGYGLVLGDPATGIRQPATDEPQTAAQNLLIERLSEEHATVRVVSGTTPLEPGDRVRVLPNHSCVVSNLVDRAWLVDGDECKPMTIAARGCIT
jgi:D-serine deaminase-like pyridoxal phosphate-dependent protein